MLLGNCSCITLLHAIHGVMDFLHSLHPCNSAVAEEQISVPVVIRGEIFRLTRFHIFQFNIERFGRDQQLADRCQQRQDYEYHAEAKHYVAVGLQSEKNQSHGDYAADYADHRQQLHGDNKAYAFSQAFNLFFGYWTLGFVKQVMLFANAAGDGQETVRVCQKQDRNGRK
jgi:hypothetical protein